MLIAYRLPCEWYLETLGGQSKWLHGRGRQSVAMPQSQDLTPICPTNGRHILIVVSSLMGKTISYKKTNDGG
jgi:hypothetical protein